MSVVTLNSDEFSSIEELHVLLKEKLKLPEYYGNNLDALWDCLTGGTEQPLTLIWIGHEECKLKIGEYADKLASIFQAAEQEVEGFKLIKL